MLLLLTAAFFTVALSEDRKYDCDMKPQRGFGRDFSQKFYYDADWNNCFGLKYGGQGGNLNRFDTYEECLRSCRHMDGSSCTMPFASVDPIQSDRGCHEKACPKGSTCSYGMTVQCCDTKLDAWGIARFDETCPNGETASQDTVARRCRDLICEKGSKCVQINPYIARCCGVKKRGNGIK
uniref:BPTI/Kunitz inhibitor domain-containing protein n=1 Tax=Steinernema glaseri TaxID=37863 RepID=A0A1I8ARE9_9BILA